MCVILPSYLSLTHLHSMCLRLLKEAQPLESKRTVEMGEEHRHRLGEDDVLFEVEEAAERKMLSRYGIWLLVELCTPKEDIPIVSFHLYNLFLCVYPRVWLILFVFLFPILYFVLFMFFTSCLTLCGLV